MGTHVTEMIIEEAITRAPPASARARRELARRVSGDLEVSLYWYAGDNSISVKVRRRTSRETLLFDVAREHALAAFYHPFAHLPPPGFPRSAESGTIAV
jgi:hypothetical protein